MYRDYTNKAAIKISRIILGTLREVLRQIKSKSHITIDIKL